jgi:hypothetical protein
MAVDADIPTDQGSQPTPSPQPWARLRSAFFAPLGDGQRRRRGSDGVKLALAVVALVCCVAAIGYSSHVDRVVSNTLHPPPRGISWLITVVYDAGSFGITGLLVLAAVATRRWTVARDLAAAAAGSVVASLILIVALGGDGGRRNPTDIIGITLHFPVIQIAVFMAVVAVSLPYLARGVQRVIELFVLLVALATVVGGHGLPVNVLGSPGHPGLGGRHLPGFGPDPRRDPVHPPGGRLRPRRRRRQAAGQGRTVPLLPRLGPDPDLHPPPAGRTRGLSHPVGRPGRRRGPRGAGRRHRRHVG